MTTTTTATIDDNNNNNTKYNTDDRNREEDNHTNLRKRNTKALVKPHASPSTSRDCDNIDRDDEDKNEDNDHSEDNEDNDRDEDNGCDCEVHGNSGGVRRTALTTTRARGRQPLAQETSQRLY
jgi:hypothetical protein